MRKSHSLSVFTIVIALLFLASTAKAAPVRVDVQAITIEYKVSWSSPFYRVFALDEAGNELIFGGQGGYFMEFSEAGLFPMPATFPTNSFFSGMGFGGATSGGSFLVTSSHSDPLKLWPTNTGRRPDNFSRLGSAGFHGSFHYDREPGYEAFDDDFVVEGTYVIDLGNARNVDGRRIQFYRFFFDLKKPVS